MLGQNLMTPAGAQLHPPSFDIFTVHTVHLLPSVHCHYNMGCQRRACAIPHTAPWQLSWLLPLNVYRIPATMTSLSLVCCLGICLDPAQTKSWPVPSCTPIVHCSLTWPPLHLAADPFLYVLNGEGSACKLFFFCNHSNLYPNSSGMQRVLNHVALLTLLLNI
jgi:hypothetical protein